MKKIAILGAGLSGATAASYLTKHGHQVTVFDKGRSAGGRMSSKRTAQGYLDMGAQYFTARTDPFRQQVNLWLESGIVELWPCDTALLSQEHGVSRLTASTDEQQRFIGTPSMQSPVKALLQDITLHLECRIETLEQQQQRWTLRAKDGASYADFDAVLLTLPPLQAQQLLQQSGLAEVIPSADHILEPCWAVAMQADALPHADAIFCQHPKLRFISHQQYKTGRHSCYILHFNAQFSRQYLDESVEFWFDQATHVLRDDLKVQQDIIPLVAHRWLYASQNEQWQTTGLIALPKQQLWLSGDWCYGGRVENAYLAGLELAQSFLLHNTTSEV